MSDSKSSSSNNEPDDLISPYFLHHSDNLGTLLVSQVLTGDNYPTWSRAITMAFEAKNNLGFVDGRSKNRQPLPQNI